MEVLFMRKIVLVVVLIFVMLAAQFSLADNAGIPKTHWVSSLMVTLGRDYILIGNETIVIGSKVGYKTFLDWINRIENNVTVKTQSKIEITKGYTDTLSRIEAVKMSIQYLGFDWLAQQLKNSNLSFSDVSTDKGYVQLALDFGIVSEGNKIFRPDDKITSEEAIALIYHLDRLKKSKIDMIHSYYAINSYSQVDKVKQLDALSYGWSRLEISKVNGDIILNSSSQNDNEYRVPSGYTEAVKAADNASVDKYLMVAVKD